jgi:hypothetical protein
LRRAAKNSFTVIYRACPGRPAVTKYPANSVTKMNKVMVAKLNIRRPDLHYSHHQATEK